MDQQCFSIADATRYGFGSGLFWDLPSTHTYQMQQPVPSVNADLTTSFLNAIIPNVPTLSRAEMEAIQLSRARRMAKRTRTETACRPCKAKKMRCNDSLPCARCVESDTRDQCVRGGDGRKKPLRESDSRNKLVKDSDSRDKLVQGQACHEAESRVTALELSFPELSPAISSTSTSNLRSYHIGWQESLQVRFV
jgi:hypothetical protein